ncbi:MAG: ABC transporter ATP-binding protein [Senegalia sp. (in: firmicutes)]|uniref:ABC transporter ATP-binding protein n=1 Tax=Senegalia sp. (in: firmicutes) TaxID=1924098 RepID=UPI003F98394A
MNEPLIEIRNLKKYFKVKNNFFKSNDQYVKAVDDISFNINKGETLGLVGESGCGKSTIGRTITRLYEPTSGEIIFDGNNISNMKEKDLKKYRKDMQIIFQDPFASLNPYMTVCDIINEPLEMFDMSKKDRFDIIYNLLEKVGLNKDDMDRYPGEFSGGQRQRIGIARALSVKPKFILCDEPTSALDVSIQAQVINLLKDLQDEFGLTYLFISHDLSMVNHISHRIGVMYLGKLVEITKSDRLYKNPLHPYTKALLSSIPIADPNLSKKRNREILKGDVPSPINPPSGCRFKTRCKYKIEKCENIEPELRELEEGHSVACHVVS